MINNVGDCHDQNNIQNQNQTNLTDHSPGFPAIQTNTLVNSTTTTTTNQINNTTPTPLLPNIAKDQTKNSQEHSQTVSTNNVSDIYQNSSTPTTINNTNNTTIPPTTVVDQTISVLTPMTNTSA